MTYGNKNIIHCTKVSEIPKEPHYAIVVDENYSEYHGYEPDLCSTKAKVNYTAYLDILDWESELSELVISNKKNFKAMYVKMAEISVKTSVSIE